MIRIFNEGEGRPRLSPENLGMRRPTLSQIYSNPGSFQEGIPGFVAAPLKVAGILVRDVAVNHVIGLISDKIINSVKSLWSKKKPNDAEIDRQINAEISKLPSSSQAEARRRIPEIRSKIKLSLGLRESLVTIYQEAGKKKAEPAAILMTEDHGFIPFDSVEEAKTAAKNAGLTLGNVTTPASLGDGWEDGLAKSGEIKKFKDQFSKPAVAAAPTPSVPPAIAAARAELERTKNEVKQLKKTSKSDTGPGIDPAYAKNLEDAKDAYAAEIKDFKAWLNGKLTKREPGVVLTQEVKGMIKELADGLKPGDVKKQSSLLEVQNERQKFAQARELIIARVEDAIKKASGSAVSNSKKSSETSKPEISKPADGGPPPITLAQDQQRLKDAAKKRMQELHDMLEKEIGPGTWKKVLAADSNLQYAVSIHASDTVKDLNKANKIFEDKIAEFKKNAAKILAAKQKAEADKIKVEAEKTKAAEELKKKAAEDAAEAQKKVAAEAQKKLNDAKDAEKKAAELAKNEPAKVIPIGGKKKLTNTEVDINKALNHPHSPASTHVPASTEAAQVASNAVSHLSHTETNAGSGITVTINHSRSSGSAKKSLSDIYKDAATNSPGKTLAGTIAVGAVIASIVTKLISIYNAKHKQVSDGDLRREIEMNFEKYVHGLPGEDTILTRSRIDPVFKRHMIDEIFDQAREKVLRPGEKGPAGKLAAAVGNIVARTAQNTASSVIEQATKFGVYHTAASSFARGKGFQPGTKEYEQTYRRALRIAGGINGVNGLAGLLGPGAAGGYGDGTGLFSQRDISRQAQNKFNLTTQKKANTAMLRAQDRGYKQALKDLGSSGSKSKPITLPMLPGPEHMSAIHNQIAQDLPHMNETDRKRIEKEMATPYGRREVELKTYKWLKKNNPLALSVEW